MISKKNSLAHQKYIAPVRCKSLDATFFEAKLATAHHLA